MLKVDLPKDLPATRVWTRLRTRSEETLDAAFACFVVAGRNEQAKALVELPVGLADGTLVVVGLASADAPSHLARAKPFREQ